jgi:glycerophosphoryl diester phosphodiesterase
VESTDYSLDIFEFDLHLTADGELVLLHDDMLDRTSDAVAYFGQENVDVGTKTYAELLNLNMGAQFVADDGTMPYADLTGDEVPDDLRIIRLQDALAYLEANGSYGYIIEIKNSGELGYEAADKLHAILAQFDCLDRAVVGTFHNEVTAYMDANYPDMLRSAGVIECAKFYFSALLNLDRDPDSFGFQALQIPTTDYIINLGTARVVNYAHRYNIAVQYWTINDPDEMARLQSIGADAIMTDVPDVGATVLNQP